MDGASGGEFVKFINIITPANLLVLTKENVLQEFSHFSNLHLFWYHWGKSFKAKFVQKWMMQQQLPIVPKVASSMC